MIPQCLSIACLIGLRPIVNKHLLKIVETNSLIVISGIINFIFILLYLLFIEKDKVIQDFHKISKDKTAMALLIFITFTIFIVIDYLAYELFKKHKVYVVESIIAIYPLITIAIGIFILDEHITYMHLLGIIFIITGVIILVQPE